MRINSYAIIHRAVDEGVERGVRRAFKHTDQPSQECIMQEVGREVMNAIDEVFTFEDCQDDGF